MLYNIIVRVTFRVYYTFTVPPSVRLFSIQFSVATEPSDFSQVNEVPDNRPKILLFEVEFVSVRFIGSS